MINGVLVINKQKGCTSRDVVNEVSKILGTKKIGHTGTLDPIAEGVLVLCIGKALKISELLTAEKKEYIASMKFGIETDMLDITGKVIQEKDASKITDEMFQETLKKFVGKQFQEVPLYSAVKINGKKLYQYARENKPVELPKKEIEIYSIEPLERKNDEFRFKCIVSKGTYIRSLIRDIGYELDNYATMTELIRTKQGFFDIDNSYTVNEIKENNYHLISILEALPDIKKINVSGKLLFQIKNGMILNKFFEEDKVFVLDDKNNILALYRNDENNLSKPWKMF